MERIERGGIGLTYLGVRDKIRQALGRYNIVVWDKQTYPGTIVWRFEGDMTKIDGFEVRPGEVVIYARTAAGLTVVQEVGVWKIDAKYKLPGLGLTWIDIGGVHRLKWGVTDVLSKELARIGAHGFLDVRIDNPMIFLERIVAGRTRYTISDLDAWVKAEMAAVMKQVLQDYDLIQLNREREAFRIAAREKCDEAFSQWGLGFTIFEVSGLATPPITDEVKAGLARKVERTTAEIEAQAEIAKRELLAKTGIDILEIEGETHKQRALAGFVAEKSKVDLTATQGAEQVSQIQQRIQRDQVETQRLRGLAEAAVLAQMRLGEIAGQVEMKKLDGSKEVEIKRLDVEGRTAEHNAILLMGLLMKDQEIHMVKELAEVMQKMAEASAKGGIEGDRTRKQVEGEFAQLLQKAGVNLAKLEQAKALGIVPKDVLFVAKD